MSQLFRNNVRLRAPEIPSGFSERLRAFFTSQPEFNNEVIKQLEDSQKIIVMQAQKLTMLERQLNNLESNLDAAKNINRGSHYGSN